MKYGYSKKINKTVDDAVDKVTEELQKKGFGVLTEIDVKATMKKKLDVDFRPYRILGACNPPFAYKALEAIEDIGLLMPCNVIVYENTEGETVVSAIEADAMLSVIDNEDLQQYAEQISEKLHKVIDAV